MKVLEKFTNDLSNINTVEELRDRFSLATKLLGYHGFDAFTVKTGTVDNADQDCNLFVCDYGIELPRSYVRDGWLQMDPVTAEIARTSKPFDYVEHLRNSQKNASVIWQLSVLKLKNVHQAWLVPMCTIGHMRGMTIYMQGKSSACEQGFQSTQHEIHLLCIDFMEEFVRLSDKKTEVDEWFAGEFDKSLVSPREVDCLHWASRGKTNWEIGEILKISENTVRFHLKNVFTKLGSNTRSSAVNRALSVGIINI